MSSTAAQLSTPKQQSLHLRLPSCPPAPKRQQQPQLLANNDSMLLDLDLPTLPALNLQQIDLSYSTPIPLKPRRSSNHKFSTNLHSQSPWKVCQTVKHSSRLGSPRLGSANLTQTFADINLTHTFANTALGGTSSNKTSSNTTTSVGGTTNKKRMSKLSLQQIAHPPLNRRQQQQKLVSPAA